MDAGIPDPLQVRAFFMTAVSVGMMSQMAEVRATSSRQRWTLLLACTAAFMLLLDITVVDVALPSIQRELHASCPMRA